jgi:tRNA (mo5U34)-methyltransferase
MHYHFSELLSKLSTLGLEQWHYELPSRLGEWEKAARHGNATKWHKLIDKLPKITTQSASLGSTVTLNQPAISEYEQKVFNGLLKQFKPWRKGPYNIFGVDIDTEWRSDFKWDRIAPHISPLANRNVLDVGCGSGYHMWRMLEQQAKCVVGVDPTELFFNQFLILKRYLPNEPVYFIPLGIEDIPVSQAFDTVFSMGVFYHRRDPILFLQQLKDQLVSGGELVLETLIVPGCEQTVLVPADRYAQMSNVWYLPSVKALTLWLSKVGFVNIRIVDIDQTSTDEQRKTEWIEGQSLVDFLDPNDPNLTIEGYPAPTRATVIANRK